MNEEKGRGWCEGKGSLIRDLVIIVESSYIRRTKAIRFAGIESGSQDRIIAYGTNACLYYSSPRFCPFKSIDKICWLLGLSHSRGTELGS